MELIQANGFEFEVIVEGPKDAQPVVLLHGFPETNFQWRRQIPELLAAGYRVIAPNLRGISPGARPEEERDYHVDSLIQDVIAISDVLSLPRFHLLGHDWGGLLGWFIAANFADRLYSLSVASTPHPAAFRDALLDPASGQAELSSYMDEFRKPDYAEQMTADNAAGLRVLYELSGVEDEAAEHYLQYFSEQKTLHLFLNWYRQIDLQRGENMPAINVPTLYVWSDNDIALGEVAAKNSEKFVSGPYQFEILAGVNHWLPEQADAAFNQYLIQHIKKYG